MKRFATFMVAASFVTVIGCGGGANPTGPSNTIPNVVGNYNGNLTITFPEIPATLNCLASTSVTQSGSTVSIAPIVLRAGSAECAGLSIPVGQGTIDATGNMTNESGTYNEPSCGTYNYTGTAGFFGKDLRIAMNATSRTCFNFNVTATLTRP